MLSESVVECCYSYFLCIARRTLPFIYMFPAPFGNYLSRGKPQDLPRLLRQLQKVVLLVLPSPRPRLYCNNPLAQWDDIVASDSCTHTVSYSETPPRAGLSGLDFVQIES